MKRKTYRVAGVKLDGDSAAGAEGSFTAAFAQLNIIDKDRDITVPGSFKQGQAVRIASWGHGWGELPVGKGIIREDGDWAFVDGQFFLDTPQGDAHYKTVKGLGDLQEWSYGFDILDFEAGMQDGERVRVLRSMDVHEVSPVMIGAGVGTHTASIKGATEFGDLPLYPQDTEWNGAEAIARIREWAGGEDDIDWGMYSKAFLWFDDANPEKFGSYKLPIADVTDGELAAVPAALSAAAGALDGARGAGVDIPDEDAAKVRGVLEKYYAKMADEFDDESIVAPWNAKAVDTLQAVIVYEATIARSLGVEV